MSKIFKIFLAIVVLSVGFAVYVNVTTDKTTTVKTPITSQIDRESKVLEVKNDELKKNKDQEDKKPIQTLARNESIYKKNDSIISLMDGDSAIVLLTINLSKKVRDEWRHGGGVNDTASKANKQGL